jgi:hypothetical protein
MKLLRVFTRTFISLDKMIKQATTAAKQPISKDIKVFVNKYNRLPKGSKELNNLI